MKLTNLQIDPEQLRGSVPEYLWFTIAILGIFAILWILNKLVSNLISTVRELKIRSVEQGETIATIKETLVGVKEILKEHEHDIREIRNK